MGFTIIVVGIFILSVIYAITNADDFWDVIFGALVGLIGAAIAGVVLTLFSFFPNTEPVLKEEVLISALKDKSNMSGEFFLGSGYISNNQYYFYIEDTSKGKRMRKIPVDEAYINENDENPRLEIYVGQFTGKFARFMYGDRNAEEEYLFFVPENTVTTDFNIDME